MDQTRMLRQLLWQHGQSNCPPSVVAHTVRLFTSVLHFLLACMLTGMLKLCKNAAKNCLATLYLYKQTAKAKNLQEGILECLNSADFNSVTRTSPQNELFTPWTLRLFKPGLSISVFDQWVMVNLAPMDLTCKATVSPYFANVSTMLWMA